MPLSNSPIPSYSPGPLPAPSPLNSFTNQQESRESTEIRLLRDEFHQHQERFRDHDEKDEARYVATQTRLNSLENGQTDIKAFMRGRANALAVLMAALAIAIPLLTVIATAAFGPHAPVKP